MKLSSELLRLWGILEPNFTSAAPAVDCFGVACRPWEQAAIAWDSVGILEKEYYDPVNGKYGKPYDEIRKLMRECAGVQNRICTDEEYEAEVHALWWGCILTAIADEKTKASQKQQTKCQNSR